MIVRYSKSFEKSVRKLSGKVLESVKNMIIEVISAEELNDITDCKRLSGFDNVYRIRIGDLRALFLLTVIQGTDTGNESGEIIVFEYLVSRGQAYSKKITEQLRQLDK
jgi:mRNA-degrading endonuclease RelE of RelBE toxin-antitoxin system